MNIYVIYHVIKILLTFINVDWTSHIKNLRKYECETLKYPVHETLIKLRKL